MSSPIKNSIYQFKITLKDTRPPVWRRILVPGTYTFWELHVAIQNAMGWQDYHLHEFEFPKPEGSLSPNVIGIPEGDFDQTLDGRLERICEWFKKEGTIADYAYDFGDSWHHKVFLEKIIPQEPGVQYPRCIKGRCICPPEDCGGVWGYQEICEGIHPAQEHYDVIYDNEGEFAPTAVVFDDPEEHWKEMQD